jgi:hypothetical protein
MMAKERIKNDEMEDGAMFNTNINDAGRNSSDEISAEVVYKQDQGSQIYPVDCWEKSNMVHRRWVQLYDHDGSKHLKEAMKNEEAMKRHLYKMRYGEVASTPTHFQ